MSRRHLRAQTLVIVVWVMGLLTVAVGSLVARATHELRLGFFPAQRVQARAVLEAALAEAQAQLAADDAATDALNACGAATLDGWLTQPPLEQAVGEGTYTIGAPECPGLVDEGGKLSLNHASAAALEQLIGAVSPEGAPETLAAAILDWRDETPGAFCAAASPPCRNGAFASVDELRLVPGMTPTLFGALAPYVTAFTDGAVNANTASLEVLNALGHDGAALLEQRAGQPFTPANPPPGGLATASPVFTAALAAQTPGGRAQARAVLHRDGRILAWQ